MTMPVARRGGTRIVVSACLGQGGSPSAVPAPGWTIAPSSPLVGVDLERVDPADAPAVNRVADLAGAVDAGEVVRSLDRHRVIADPIPQFEPHLVREEVATREPRFYHAGLDVVDLDVDRSQVTLQVPSVAELEATVASQRRVGSVDVSLTGELGDSGIGAAGGGSGPSRDLV